METLHVTQVLKVSVEDGSLELPFLKGDMLVAVRFYNRIFL